MTEKSASVHWEGRGKKGVGQISTETGALKAYPYGFASRFEDDRSGTNPEEILGAAHAACFTMAFSFACDKAGFATTSVDTQAKVRLVAQGDGFAIDRIALTLEASMAGIDEATFQALAEAAKKACPLSKALASVHEITLKATLHQDVAAAAEPSATPATGAAPAASAVPSVPAVAAVQSAAKTNFSFEVQYVAQSETAIGQREEVMKNLGPALQALLAATDSAATVVVSDSHKGSGNKIVELVSTLQDEQIAKVLQGFSEQNGVTISALE